MDLSIYNLTNSVKFGTIILLVFLLLISLAIKNLELSIGTMAGGIAGIGNFILLSRVVAEITKTGKGLYKKTYIIFLTSARYIIMSLSLLIGILISKTCLVFVLVALILPQIIMMIVPLLEKD